LQVLHAFEMTEQQLKGIAALAARTAQKPPPRKGVRVSDKFRKALLGYRAALASGDDDRIETALTAFEQARAREMPDFDEVEITDAARKEAPLLLKKLSARQVALYLSGQAEDFPDPAERLMAAMKESRKLRGKEWHGLRDDTAYQVGWLVAGLDAAEEEKVRDRATALLNRAAAMDEKGYTKELPALRKSAREMAGKIGPTDVIRHYVQRVLAETLSNHRLADAIEALREK
jgi:hypothetical protein